MLPRKYDWVDLLNETDPTLSILQAVRIGQQWVFAAQFFESTGPDVPEDLSGDTFEFHARETNESTTFMFRGITGGPGTNRNNIPITANAQGVVKLILPPDYSKHLLPLTGTYSLVRTTGGVDEPRMEGLLEIVRRPFRG